MAALIDGYHVTAVYPGFHKVEGDASALAANGVNRRMSNGWGSQDAIVIRRIAILDAKQSAAFDFDEALKLAGKYEHRMGFGQTVASQPFANRTKTKVCGSAGYGFTKIEHITQPVFNSNPVDWTDFSTFVVALIGSNVWLAQYTRLYEPELGVRVADLITFTSNFCVK